MNYSSTILRYLSFLVAFFWIIAGAAIIGSIYLSTIGFAVNIIGGSLFVAIGVFFHRKARGLLQILDSVAPSEKLKRRVALAEIAVLAVMGCVGAIACHAIWYRVFVEGMAVFG